MGACAFSIQRVYYLYDVSGGAERGGHAHKNLHELIIAMSGSFDGGHTMPQQINTFEELFHHVDKKDVYLCEDSHTSYWPEFGGGHKKRVTFIEYSKNFIDYIHAWHSAQPRRVERH